jgi:hypothetical protein
MKKAEMFTFIVRVRLPNVPGVAVYGTELESDHLNNIRHLINQAGISDDEAWKRAAFDNIRMGLEKDGVDVTKVQWLSVHKQQSINDLRSYRSRRNVRCDSSLSRLLD